MSDLFTKAANVRTTVKLWIVGIALLIMVNIPYTDNHYQPTPVAAPVSHPSGGAPLTSPMNVTPPPLSSNTTNTPSEPSAPLTSLSSVAGDYTGFVHNETAGVSAAFAIILQDSGGTLSGSMTVNPPLYGSGPLEGAANGRDVAFTVTSSIGKIAFAGTRFKRNITGTYTVTQPSGGKEKGKFTLERAARARPESAAAAKEEPTVVTPPIPSIRAVEPQHDLATVPTPTPRVQVHSDPKNLSYCLSGYATCDHSILTPDENAEVAANDKRRNLSYCLNGYATCNHNLLTEEEALRVTASDLKRNLSYCQNGYATCNRNLLTSQEAIQVAHSDKRRNLSYCLNGYATCNRTLLTQEESVQVSAADIKRNLSSCLNGYGTCSHSLLTSQEEAQVAANDRKRNLSSCLNGYATCNRNLLTIEELTQVLARDKQRQH